jgi:hypothetical protein
MRQACLSAKVSKIWRWQKSQVCLGVNLDKNIFQDACREKIIA